MLPARAVHTSARHGCSQRVRRAACPRAAQLPVSPYSLAPRCWSQRGGTVPAQTSTTQPSFFSSQSRVVFHRANAFVREGDAQRRWGAGGVNSRHERTRSPGDSPVQGPNCSRNGFFSPCLLEFLPPAQRRKALRRDYLLRSASAICWIRFLLTGTENCFQLLSIFVLFFPSLSSFLPCSVFQAQGPGRAQPINSPLMAAPMPSHSSAGLRKSSRGFAGGLGGKGKKKPIWRRDHIFSVSSPFVLYLWRTKAGAGWRWGAGSGGSRIPQKQKSPFSWECPEKGGANLGRGETQSWGKNAGGGSRSASSSLCGWRGEKENKQGWKFSRRHRELFEALEYIFFFN